MERWLCVLVIQGCAVGKLLDQSKSEGRCVSDPRTRRGFLVRAVVLHLHMLRH